MIDFDNLIVIGATNRNLGKTEFISRLIKRFREHEIIAVKVKSIYPGDNKYHGKDLDQGMEYIVRKESLHSGLDDSKRFLSSGAKDVFYVKSNFPKLGEAVCDIKSKYQDSQLYIAESNSILGYFKPGGFIMICGPDKSIYKPSSIRFMQNADLIINSDGMKFDINPEDLNITIENNKWYFE